MVRVIGGKIISNKNYLELAELRFESVRVKIQNTYVGNPGVRVSEGSSYRESTVLTRKMVSEKYQKTFEGLPATGFR